MDAATTVFLFVILNSGPVSLSQIGEFKSKTECVAARDAVQKVSNPSANVQFVCISKTSLEDLEKVNR